jgi:hypothetical protein
MGSNPLRGDVKRSEQVLQFLADKMGISDAGREAIIAAFDPFHDREINYTGWPDSDGRHSLGQVMTLTTQVSAPAGLTAGTNWDCHIVDWPFFGPTNSKPATTEFNSTVSALGASPPGVFSYGTSTNQPLIGGLGIYTFQASAGSNQAIFDNTAMLTSQTLAPSGSDINNPWRVTGRAFEVYNTSSELNKQGSICIYKQPQPSMDSSTSALIVNQTATPPTFSYLDVLLSPAPPVSASEALRLPDSRQWDAEEGCYVINTMLQDDISPHIVNYSQPLLYQAGLGSGKYYGYGLTTNAIPTATPALNTQIPLDNNYTTFNMTGAIIQGLNANSTLTVNQRLFIEVFPSSTSSLANFSHPSPMCDRAALALYSEIISRAPVGVPVRYNSLGEWFNNAVSSVAKAIGPAIQTVAKVVPDPRLKAVALATKAFTKTDKSSNQPKQNAGSKTTTKKKVAAVKAKQPNTTMINS